MGKKRVRTGLFILKMNRKMTESDVARLTGTGPFRFCFADGTGREVSIQFEELEVKADDHDPARLFCHGLKPEPSEGFLSGIGNLVQIKGLFLGEMRTPLQNVESVENCIFDLAGTGTAEEPASTKWMEQSLVRGLNTYTIFCRCKRRLLDTLQGEEIKHEENDH